MPLVVQFIGWCPCPKSPPWNGPKISAAFKLLAQDGDLSIGEVTIKNHRTRTCSCYEPGGEFHEEGKK